MAVPDIVPFSRTAQFKTSFPNNCQKRIYFISTQQLFSSSVQLQICFCSSLSLSDRHKHTPTKVLQHTLNTHTHTHTHRRNKPSTLFGKLPLHTLVMRLSKPLPYTARHVHINSCKQLIISPRINTMAKVSECISLVSLQKMFLIVKDWMETQGISQHHLSFRLFLSSTADICCVNYSEISVSPRAM